MKLTIDDHVVDVVFNPAGRNDGRPDAGTSYTASLRADSTDGSAKLTVATDFTPPCVLAALPEWSTSLAFSVLAELGFYAPSQSGWMIGRPGVYAFADGVTYVEATPDEKAFMASFGFTPGARFNLALPMLRAQRAELAAGGWRTETPPDLDAALTAMAGVDDAGDVLEFVMLETTGKPDGEMTIDEVEATQRAAEYPEVGGAGVPTGSAVVPAETLPTPPKRRRRAAPKGAKAQAVTPADDVPAQQADAIADVFDALDAAPAAADVNPFAIEGL